MSAKKKHSTKKRDEREKNLAELLEDLGVSQQEADVAISDPDKTGCDMLVSSTVAVGFPPNDRHMEKFTEKSLKQLALAILTWKAGAQPVPMKPQSHCVLL